jgi:hypothetical protein
MFTLQTHTHQSPSDRLPVRRRLADPVFGVVVVLAVCLLPPPAPALAAITWDAVEPVDQLVTEVASTSGASALYANGAWHVVYCRGGQVRHRARGAGGWQGIETVSTTPGTARDPHLAWTGSTFYVAWEDDRTGIPAVWVRTFNGGSWSAETCLTGDAVPSRAPALAAVQDGVLVAWEQGESPSRVLGRFYAGYWQAPVTISGGAGSATEPTVSMMDPWSGSLAVAWADTRHGAAEIYLRTWDGSWAAESRATDLPGECRHPSMKEEFCCGDAIQTHLLLTARRVVIGADPDL